MSFIDMDKLDKAVNIIEADYNLIEREVLIKLLQERISNSKVKVKQSEAMSMALDNPIMKKIKGLYGGD